MEFSRTRDPAWRREGAEGRILAKSERVFPKSGASLTEDDETKIPGKGKGLTALRRATGLAWTREENTELMKKHNLYMIHAFTLGHNLVMA